MHPELQRSEADEAAEGKGISASSFFPPVLFCGEGGKRKMKEDASRFIHTLPDISASVSQRNEKVEKGTDISASLNFKSLWLKGSFTVWADERKK